MAYLGETSTPKLWKRMKAYINNRIANLEQGITMELLWQNASPTSSFAEQTIKASFESDDIAVISARPTTAHTTTEHLFFMKVGKSGVINFAIATNGEGNIKMEMFSRNMAATTTGVVFGVGYAGAIGSSSASSGINNIVCVPVAIYKLKGVK